MIQVGQVLDKYELLERVGQGGMAVVYRGIDRQLKRTVAIKILHRHLSDYQEARDRFEREAQAVAKLRHENILEIFDYKASTESYIVTEFIDGLTLKQFITDRPIQYPEVGAMVILQVCRALSHAHASGILHRDIKPENIMIRSDGVVKLMDFGISHMVDLERLTVTGQLLGSPAYMAPEHVEGRQLDFRTDVFAVGIVLYQLTVGKLPFEGKNPHEVLKRIAECRFVDPRIANPRIGNRLGRIILKAMAAEPDQRFPAIGEMVLALEAYLEESGLPTDKVAAELSRYFKSPAPYEEALKQRLVDHLTRRGQERLEADDRAGALDIFDRVLTIDAQNEKVLSILDGINRRARLKRVAVVIAAVVAVGGGAFAIHERTKPPPPEAAVVVAEAKEDVRLPVRHTEIVPVVPVPADEPVDAAVAEPEHPIVVAAPDDAPQVPATKETRIVVNPVIPGTTVTFSDEDKPHRLTQDGVVLRQLSVAVTVKVHSELTEDFEQKVNPGDTVTAPLQFLPAHVTVKCDAPDVAITVNDKTVRSGDDVLGYFDPNATDSQKVFKVKFIGAHVDPTEQTVTVKAHHTERVTCVAQ